MNLEEGNKSSGVKNKVKEDTYENTWNQCSLEGILQTQMTPSFSVHETQECTGSSRQRLQPI